MVFSNKLIDASSGAQAPDFRVIAAGMQRDEILPFRKPGRRLLAVEVCRAPGRGPGLMQFVEADAGVRTVIHDVDLGGNLARISWTAWLTALAE